MNKKIVTILILISFSVFAIQFNIDFVSAESIVLDVTAYGAKANDNVDDTKAIQEVLDSAEPGDIVYFPVGTYIISGSLACEEKTDITIEGESQDSTVIKFSGSDVTSEMIGFSGCSGVTVSKLTFDGNNDPEITYGMTASNSRDMKVSFVTIKNLVLSSDPDNDWGPFAISWVGENGVFNGVTDSEISDCTISNIGMNSKNGCGIIISIGGSRNKILRNNISRVGRTAIGLSHASSDCIIKGNTISDCGIGGDNDSLDIEVIDHCLRTVIEDNNVDHWISLAVCSNYSAVRRNTIKDESITQYEWCQIETAGCSFNSITNNYAAEGAQCGISGTGSEIEPIKYNYFGHNTFTNNAMYGLFYGSGDTDYIANNYFYDNDFIYSQADNANIDNPDHDGYGINLSGSISNLSFEECSISNNEDTGVFIADGSDVNNLSFINSTISNNTVQAFNDYKTYTAFEMNNCTVAGNGDNTVPEEKSFGSGRPTAVISGPVSGSTGQEYSFASQSTDDGEISFALWDFGDGPAKSGNLVKHIYTSPGTYKITLIVWDNNGRADSVEKDIVIDGNETVLLQPVPATPSSENTGKREDTNLCLNADTAVSGFIKGQDGSFAVDGYTDTPAWYSEDSGEKWLVVDLGGPKTIGRWLVKHAGAAGQDGSRNTCDFKLQKSNSAEFESWTDVDEVSDNKEDITDRYVEPFNARYVRLSISKAAQPDCPDDYARVYEFQLFAAEGAVLAQQNLALKKPVTASEGFDEGCGPENAVDGSTETWEWGPTGDEKWIVVDLGAAMPVERWVVKHAGAVGEDPAYNTRDFVLSRSMDGNAWDPMDEVENNGDHVTDRVVSMFTARYVKLEIIAPAQTEDERQGRIYEFELYGPEGTIIEAPDDLALYKPVIASEGFDDGCYPENAVDGQYDTWEWGATGDDKWVIVDLEQEYAINRWVVKHGGAAGEDQSTNTKEFKLQKSMDGTTWEEVDIVSDNTEDMTDRTVDTFTARYVRLVIVIPAIKLDETQGRIYEFELYGPEEPLTSREEHPADFSPLADGWNVSK